MGKESRPVEMISVCSTEGKLMPVRFRFENGAHEIQIAHILEIVCTKDICYVGVEEILYVCKVRVAEREHLLELKYMVQTHRWVLFREIY